MPFCRIVKSDFRRIFEPHPGNRRTIILYIPISNHVSRRTVLDTNINRVSNFIIFYYLNIIYFSMGKNLWRKDYTIKCRPLLIQIVLLFTFEFNNRNYELVRSPRSKPKIFSISPTAYWRGVKLKIFFRYLILTASHQSRSYYSYNFICN